MTIKAYVAFDFISGRKPIQEIAADHATYPIHVCQWKDQLPDCACKLSTRSKNTKDTFDSHVMKAELSQKIELVWLNNSKLSDHHKLCKLFEHNHTDLSISRQCALLGLLRSTLYCRQHHHVVQPCRSFPVSISYLESFCSGSHWIVEYLAREDIPISLDRVQTSCGAKIQMRSTRSP